MPRLSPLLLPLAIITLPACGHGGAGGGCRPGDVFVPSDAGDGGVVTIPSDAAFDDAACTRACGDAQPCSREHLGNVDQILCTTQGTVCPL